MKYNRLFLQNNERLTRMRHTLGMFLKDGVDDASEIGMIHYSDHRHRLSHMRTVRSIDDRKYLVKSLPDSIDRSESAGLGMQKALEVSYEDI